VANIKELESGLKQQLADLADQIRSGEADLLTKKEGYLKVSGALEILEILKKEEEAEEAKAELEALTAAALAD
jgi:hypothetical protein